LVGNSYKATFDNGATASFVSDELAYGTLGGIDAQLEMEVKFGSKELTMSLLILPGVVDPLVLEWNFLTRAFFRNKV